MTDNPSANANANESIVSYSRIWRIFLRARRQIAILLVIFVAIATFLAAAFEKEYVAEGTVKQTDLTDVLQPPQGMSGALGLLAAANNANDRINSYISTLTSPEIAAELLSHNDFIDILFDDKWIRIGNSTIWKHRETIGWSVRQLACYIFSIKCSDQLSPLQVSEELNNRVTVEPSATIAQGVLTNIGNTDTFDVTVRGKNPAALLRLLEFIHEAANRRIQQGQITLTEKITRNLNKRVQHLQNAEVQQQVISVLSSQEEKLAVLHAGQINYAAAWLIRPTVSVWPARPNIALLYVSALIAALIFGPIWIWASDRFLRRTVQDNSNFRSRIIQTPST